MAAPRITQDELSRIIAKKGYGITSEFGSGGLKSSFAEERAGAKIGDSGKVRNVEPSRGYESLREEAVQIGYAGICVVRIKFYRHRLADYSRANCEKYIIDSLTYAGLIRDDSETEIRLEDEGQEKVATKAEERVEVVLEYPEVDLDALWVPKTKFGNASQK